MTSEVHNTPGKNRSNQYFHPNAAISEQNNIDMNRVQALKNRLIPIGKDYLDKKGNLVRLWEIKDSSFCGTVLDIQGNVYLVPVYKIINPLSKGSSTPALQKIKKIKNLSFDLVFKERTGEIIIWPHLVASGQDQIEGFISISETPESLDYQEPQFSDKKDVLGHIFRKTEGHFERDTPENRAYIFAAVSRSENKVGVNRHGVELYFQIMPNGTQAWAHVEKGVITNGGLNLAPMKWVVDSREILGGKLVPIKSHASSKYSINFHDRAQVNKISAIYNSCHPKKPIALHPSESPNVKGEVKGVSHTVGIIPNFLEELRQSENNTDYSFFIPDPKNDFSLTESEVQQILRELARGIYIYESIPFISLHFNPQKCQYPVIHPAYQDTFIGYVISMLDYSMKGFWNGSFFEDTFILDWHKNPSMDEKFLREKNINVRELCNKHLVGGYLTFDEIFLEVEKRSGTSSKGLAFGKGFDISFRIRSKQNSIRKTEHLFMIDGDFDVLFTIGNKPSSKDQEIHFQNLKTACDLMCKQIKEKLPLLPGLKKLFHALNLMNFFVYYFNTLKAAGKIPTFAANFFPKESRVCPPVFPPLLTSELTKMSFKPTSLFKHLSKEQTSTFISYLKQPNTKILEESAINILTTAIKHHILRKTSSRDLNTEDYKALAKALLPTCKARYQSTHHSAETTLITMQIKKNPQEQLTEKVIFSRMDTLYQRLENDIESVKKMISDNKKRGISYSEESQWLLEYEEGKKSIIKYKPILQGWFQDPLATICDKLVLCLNLATKEIKITKEDHSTGNIQAIGGCSFQVKDMEAHEDAEGYFLLEKYGAILSSLPSEKLIRVESRKKEEFGLLFKLPFEEFYIIEGDSSQSAIGYLCHSPPQYPMNEAIALSFHAIATQDEKLFIEVADKIKNWNFQDALGASFVHYAASVRSVFFLRELIKRKADLTVRDPQGFTPFHYAARNGNTASLKILIEAVPGLVDSQSINGETPLYLAAQNNQLSAVQLLLKEKTDINRLPTHGMNPLMCALHHGNEDVALELLRDSSIDIWYCLVDGRMPLHFSIEMKLEKVLKELVVVHGADVNRGLRNGYKPIHLAVAHNWLNGVKILAASPFIKLDATLNSGKSALELATENNQKEILEFLTTQKKS